MCYSIYADLTRQLTRQERATLFEALDSTVPGSGPVGQQKGPHDEVYFSVDAPTKEKASEQAARYMGIILQKSGLDIDYTLTLQTSIPVSRHGHSPA